MKEHAIDAILATPPGAVGAAVVFLGMSLSTWVALLTILYTVILIVVKMPAMVQAVRKLIRWVKNRRIDEQSD